MIESIHDWETGIWGVDLGVSRCKTCGKLSTPDDFTASTRDGQREAYSVLVTTSQKILVKLLSPTLAVTALDALELDNALAPFRCTEVRAANSRKDGE